MGVSSAQFYAGGPARRGQGMCLGETKPNRQHDDAFALNESRLEAGARSPSGEVGGEPGLNILHLYFDSKVRVAHLTRPILASRTDFAQYSEQRGVLSEGASGLPACQGSSAVLQSAAVRLRDC